MGVGSQKGKGSEMAFDTEFSARWESKIIILFLSCYRDRKIAYTKSKCERLKMSNRNLGHGILDGVKEIKSVHKGQKELETHIRAICMATSGSTFIKDFSTPLTRQ